MAGHVEDRDLGWIGIKAEINALRSLYVQVGIQDDAEAEENGTPMALVGAVNEFGSHDGHVPERSFMRSTMDENRDKYYEAMGKGLDEIYAAYAGKKSGGAIGLGRKLLKVIGLRVESDIKNKIVSNVPPPNAPSTIARKGSSTTLVDKGALKNSIRNVVKDG